MSERALTSIDMAQGVQKQFLTPCNMCDFDPSDCGYQFKAGSKSPVTCGLNGGASITMDIVERANLLREYTIAQARVAFPADRLK